MSTYAIGDIQGCYKPLKRLLKLAGFSPARDRLWCVGDLVNRGPRSADTLRYLQDLGPAVRPVLGNHDLHFLALHEGRAPRRGKDTLDDLLQAPDCGDLARWLRRQPLAHYEEVETRKGREGFFMVHAGVAPSWSLKTALKLAGEVERALQGPGYRAYLKAMYGDTPDRWRGGLEGKERLRVITNYLTRVRFCDKAGRMHLQVKEGYRAAPKGCKPWFKLQRITPAASILFGHWAAIEGRTGSKHVIALDTGYVWGGALTMLRLEDRKKFTVSP